MFINVYIFVLFPFDYVYGLRLSADVFTRTISTRAVCRHDKDTVRSSVSSRCHMTSQQHYNLLHDAESWSNLATEMTSLAVNLAVCTEAKTRQPDAEPGSL